MDTTVEIYLDDQLIGKSCVKERYEFVEQFKKKQKTIKNFSMDRIKLKPVKKFLHFNSK
jgi:hypothetical protein